MRQRRSPAAAHPTAARCRLSQAHASVVETDPESPQTTISAIAGPASTAHVRSVPLLSSTRSGPQYHRIGNPTPTPTVPCGTSDQAHSAAFGTTAACPAISAGTAYSRYSPPIPLLRLPHARPSQTAETTPAAPAKTPALPAARMWLVPAQVQTPTTQTPAPSAATFAAVQTQPAAAPQQTLAHQA